MPPRNVVFLIVIAIYEVSNPANGIKKDWTYKLTQVNWNTTNPDVFKTPMRTVRISPNVYGLNGSIIFGVDVTDEYELEAKLVRSPSGSSHYIMTPFAIPKSPFSEFINKYYRPIFMEKMKSCTNLPQFEENWKPPLQKGEYVMNSCIVDTENFPAHLDPGSYKFIIILTGPSTFGFIEVLLQVDSIFL